jgi:hypothetical protein
MRLTPLSLLISQCDTLTRRLEALDVKCPRATVPQPLFAISGLQTDLQRVIAIEMILTRLEAVTSMVPAEVFDAVNDVLETIGITYRQIHREIRWPKKSSTSTTRSAGCKRKESQHDPAN